MHCKSWEPGFSILEKEVVIKERVEDGIKPVMSNWSQEYQHRLIKNTQMYPATELDIDMYRHR